MPKSTIFLIAALALGIGILVCAARGERGPEPAPRPRPAPVERIARAPAPTPAMEDRISVAPPPVDRPVAPPSGPVSPETAAIQERLRKMEERLRELETKRDELSASNKELEKQVTEKWTEASAKSMAEWRVKSWEALLGLSETQKQSLLELCTQWGKQDAGRPADAATWLAREGDVRSRLTAEQAAKLNDTATAQANRMWSTMGRSLGSMAGAGKEEQTRLQQSLGDFRAPADMLLPEAHGADWNGLLHDALGRVKSSLTPEQTARLDKMGWK